MAKVYGVNVAQVLARLEPKSEPRPDIVERDQEMARRIAATRREKFIVCLLLAFFVVVPLVALTIQNQHLTQKERAALENVFN